MNTNSSMHSRIVGIKIFSFGVELLMGQSNETKKLNNEIIFLAFLSSHHIVQ